MVGLLWVGTYSLFCLTLFTLSSPLTAQEVNVFEQTTYQNTTSIQAKARFIPSAHVAVKYASTSASNEKEISTNGSNAESNKNISAHIIGGNKGETIIVSCYVEGYSTSKSCRQANIDGPEQTIHPGQTIHSNLTITPANAEKINDKNMSIIISFSYI